MDYYGGPQLSVNHGTEVLAIATILFVALQAVSVVLAMGVVRLGDWLRR